MAGRLLRLALLKHTRSSGPGGRDAADSREGLLDGALPDVVPAVSLDDEEHIVTPGQNTLWKWITLSK